MPRFVLLALTLLLDWPVVAQPGPPPPLASLPFDLVGGVIVLRNLAFNGRRGDFLLDTGCAYPLVVEQAAFPSQLRPLALAGLSAGGATTQYELPVTQFELGNVRPPQVAQATSLATLRAIIGPQLLGLIGTGLLRRYEVVIDYLHRRLSLYALGPGQATARPYGRRDSVAFTLEKNWPLVQGAIGPVAVRLLLDTGARENALNADLVKSLPAAIRPVGGRREQMVTPGGQVTVQRSWLPSLHLGATEWRGVPVLVAPPVRYRSGRALPYQGTLGGTFLSQEPLVSIHFGSGQFYFLTPDHP